MLSPPSVTCNLLILFMLIIITFLELTESEDWDSTQVPVWQRVSHPDIVARHFVNSHVYKLCFSAAQRTSHDPRTRSAAFDVRIMCHTSRKILNTTDNWVGLESIPVSVVLAEHKERCIRCASRKILNTTDSQFLLLAQRNLGEHSLPGRDQAASTAVTDW